jgi:hypothetical protein
LYVRKVIDLLLILRINFLYLIAERQIRSEKVEEAKFCRNGVYFRIHEYRKNEADEEIRSLSFADG